MIQGHRFRFVDQPELQKAYDAYGFDDDGVETIEVREIENHEGFGLRSHLRYMSARPCHYLANGPLDRVGPDDDWGLEVRDVLSLAWDGRRRSILYGRGRDFSPELLRFWIFHTFFPIVLELRGEYKMLHVGAVEVAGGPVFFAAPSYGGKSTLTDYFIRRGHPLYADDTLPVRREEGCCMVYPSFPYHRPYRQPETLGKPVANFARGPKPLKALFELERVEPEGEVEILPLQGVDRFKACFYSSFVKFSFLKKERFEFFTRMATEIPVFRVTVPHDLERLDEVYEAIVHCTESL